MAVAFFILYSPNLVYQTSSLKIWCKKISNILELDLLDMNSSPKSITLSPLGPNHCVIRSKVLNISVSQVFHL